MTIEASATGEVVGILDLHKAENLELFLEDIREACDTWGFHIGDAMFGWTVQTIDGRYGHVIAHVAQKETAEGIAKLVCVGGADVCVQPTLAECSREDFDECSSQK